MTSDRRKNMLITQILRETLHDQLHWHLSTTPATLTQATGKVIPLYLETDFRGKRFGVYQSRYKHFTDVEANQWSENIGLCIIQDSEVVIWQVEEPSHALHELFKLAREQASGIPELLANS